MQMDLITAFSLSTSDGGRVRKVGHLSAGVSRVVKRDLKGQPRKRKREKENPKCKKRRQAVDEIKQKGKWKESVEEKNETRARAELNNHVYIHMCVVCREQIMLMLFMNRAV